MLARPVYKPFAEAKGVELIEALDSRSKRNAIHEAFRDVGEEDHLLTRTIDLVLMPSNRDYCRLDTNEQMVNIARVYDPYIWPSFFYVLSNFFIDPATDPDEPVAVFSTLVRTYRSDPNFLSQICRLPPPEVRIGVTTRVADKLAPTLAKLSPALSECLRSRDFEMTFPYLGSAGKFADTLVKEPARTQEVAAAFLRAICRLNQPEYIVDDLAAADDPDLISFERRWNEVSAYTCMPVVKMIEEQIFTSDPEVWERVYASLENIEGYFAEIIIDNSFLKQLFKRRADFLGIKYLCGTPPEHLSIIQDYIWALQRDGFISESSDDHIIQAIISIFRSCKTGADLYFTRTIIRGAMIISSTIKYDFFLRRIVEIPAAQREALSDMLTTCFHDNFWDRKATAPCLNNNFRTGCHEDDLADFLRRMAEMPVSSIKEMEKQVWQAIKEMREQAEQEMDTGEGSTGGYKLSFFDLRRLLREQIQKDNIQFSWEASIWKTGEK